VTDLRVLGRQTFVYGLGSAAPQVVGLVTLPIVARVLTTSDYGVLEIAVVTVGLLVILADLGLASASQRSFFDYRDVQPSERRSVLTTALVTMATVACVIGMLVVALREQIADLLFGTAAEAAVVVWVAVLLIATQMSVFAREVLRLHFLAGAYVESSIIAGVLGGVVAIVGVVVVDGGPQAMLAGAVVGATAGAAYGMVRARGRYVGRFSQPELLRMLNYGIPLVPTALSVWAVTFIDRLLLQHLGSLAEVGTYGMASRLSSILLLVVTAFGIAFSPFALDLRTRDPELERALRAQVLTVLVTVLAVLGAALSVFARELLAVLAPAFEDAADTVGLLCLGTLFFGIASVVMLEISIARRTRVFAVYSAVGAAVNVGLNVALIPPLGPVGAGIATAAAFLVLAAAYWWEAQRLARTPYETGSVVKLIGAAILVGALGLLPPGPGWMLVKVAGLATFLLLLRMGGLLSLSILRAPRPTG
jgi:O-antigen/teichoic acid export membrane protein